MPLRAFFLLAAATASLAFAAGCDAKSDADSSDPPPVIHSQVRTGVKVKPGAKGGLRNHKLPMQTGPAQSSAASEL